MTEPSPAPYKSYNFNREIMMKNVVPALALAFTALAALPAHAESCRPDQGTLVTLEQGSSLQQKIVSSSKEEVAAALQEIAPAGIHFAHAARSKIILRTVTLVGIDVCADGMTMDEAYAALKAVKGIQNAQDDQPFAPAGP
ncbi:MAG TPA: hypothetical protein VIG74_06825 [Alphaproteobacteria bacterium]